MPLRTIVVLVILASSAVSCGSEGPCHEALATRRKGTPPPPCPYPGCEQIVTEPQRVVQFIFVLNKATQNSMGYFDPYPLEKKVQNWTCVSDFLRPAGASILPRDELNDVHAIGSYAQVKAAYNLASVTGVEVNCNFGTLCSECSARTEADCNADGFCRELRLRRVDLMRGCIAAPTHVMCIPRDRPCMLEETYSRDPGGNCWAASNNCIPGEWEYDPSCRPGTQSPSACVP